MFADLVYGDSDGAASLGGKVSMTTRVLLDFVGARATIKYLSPKLKYNNSGFALGLGLSCNFQPTAGNAW